MPELSQEQIATFEKGAQAMEAIKSDVLPKLSKLDAFDVKSFDDMKTSITTAMELQQKFDAHKAATEAAAKKVADDYADLLAKHKQLESAVNRPAAPSSVAEKKAELRQKANKLFNDFARVQSATQQTDLAEFARDYAKAHPDDLEVKALTVNSDPNGGYLTFPEFGGIIQSYLYESSPMRQLASVINIGTDSYEIVLDNDQAGWGWVGETQARPDTATPVLGKMNIPVNEMYAMPNASQKMLDDAIIDVEAWLAGKVSESFARGEASAFVAGNGVNKPLGILTPAAGTNVALGQVQQLYSGNGTSITYAGLIGLQNALKEPYQANATWLMQRATMAVILGIVDGQGRPIFNQMYDKNAGLETSILGRPIKFAADMPAVAANALAVAYGDFKRAYQIVDRTGIRVLRDPYTNKPFVRFYTTKRVGGAPVNFEAYKLLQIHT
ncbi:MAG: phage major capsid protein [Isosphaeraceae bacterium]